MANASSTAPTLPPEVWDIVIGNLPNCISMRDLTYVWTECRQVSKQFKKRIELSFGQAHLPKTFLNFDISMWYNPSQVQRLYWLTRGPPRKPAYGWGPPYRFDFDRLSDDRKTAIYVPWHGNQPISSLSKIQDKLERQTSTSWFDKPGQTVQFRRGMNDIAIPFLDLDHKNGELSIDWRELYTLYFTEERLFHRLCMKGVSSSPLSCGQCMVMLISFIRMEIRMIHGRRRGSP